jgi:REP element-mobilizing transposase RayT
MLTKPAAAKASRYLADYSVAKGIYMKINYFNIEHVHTLIDLRTNKCIEEVVQLFKGSSSHWINENRLLRG